MKLIVGLGNPGKKYEKTRHNVGFMAVDELRLRLIRDGQSDISEWSQSKKFNALICGCSVGGEKMILAKPLTFMNRSGHSVQLIAHYYNIVPSDIIVVHDDKDIELGGLKVQTDRGHAGHNGVRSIIDSIGSKKFLRIRIGIAPKRTSGNTAKFVLGKFGLLEKRKLDEVIRKSIDEIIKALPIDEK